MRFVLRFVNTSASIDFTGVRTGPRITRNANRLRRGVVGRQGYGSRELRCCDAVPSPSDMTSEPRTEPVG